jgi:hypothetical protein
MQTKRVLLVGLLAAVSGLGLMWPMSMARAEPQSEEAQFIVLINQLRVSKGLVPLAPDGHLTDVARGWSAQMAQAGTLSHNPNFAQQMGNGWRKLGENVGVGASVDWLNNAFINSPHHYENLVDPDFRMIGVGITDTSDGNIWVTEDFEQARSATAVPAPVTPAPNPTPSPAYKPRPKPAPAPTGGTPGAGGVTRRTPGAAAAPAAQPVVQATPTTAPPETTTTVAPPTVEAKKVTRPAHTTNGVLAASIGPPPHRMWSGFAIGCLMSLLAGLLIARMLSARLTLLRKD